MKNLFLYQLVEHFRVALKPASYVKQLSHGKAGQKLGGISKSAKKVENFIEKSNFEKIG